ncbi:tRNA (guanosine(46)-N7)-methyltransferase TrmB, partial [Candidatus Poribacteria bacterium]
MIAIKSDYFKKYMIDPRRFEKLPLDWPEIFGRDGDLIVEIGFGSGEFLEELAALNPDKNFVGFELSLISMQKAQKRFFRRGLENVRVVLVDGRFGMRELFHDGSVSRVISNFPCPWPKKKHQKRRLIVPEFARILAAVLREGGDFELVTDELWFAEEAVERFDETGCFRIEGPVADPERPIQTRYERKWKSRGKTIYLVRFI